MKRTFLTVLATFTLFLTGCASDVVLHYTPQISPAPVPGAGQIALTTVTHDSRAEKALICNDPKLRATTDVPEFVARSFDTEATDRGFLVGAGGKPVEIELKTFFLGWYRNDGFQKIWDVELKFEVNVRRSNGHDFVKEISAGRRIGPLKPTPDTAAALLDRALGEALVDLFGDPNFRAALLQ